MLQEKRRSSRASGMALDMLHVIVGVLIVIFAVLAFLNPEENRILFPAIFFLASVLNLANGYDCFRRNRGKRKKMSGRNGAYGSGCCTVYFYVC